jgi:hypothetical protein
MNEQNLNPDLSAISKEYGEMIGHGMDPELADKEIRRRYPSLEGNADWKVLDLVAFKPFRAAQDREYRQRATGFGNQTGRSQESGGSGSDDDEVLSDVFSRIRYMVRLSYAELDRLATAIANAFIATPSGKTLDGIELVCQCAERMGLKLSELESLVLAEAVAGYAKSFAWKGFPPDAMEQAKRASLEQAALAGDSQAMLDLGAKLVLQEKYGQARFWLEKGAAAGIPGAMCGLAKLFNTGKGGTYDHKEALRWMNKAAEAGYTEAMVHLEDIDSLQKAASGGDREAMLRLGFWHKEKKAKAQARSWFERGAAAGDPDAMLEIGIICERRRDYTEARSWFERGAAAGGSGAMCALGKYLAQGMGGSKDDAAAGQWVRKAAEAGHAEAMLILGESHRIGLGEPRDAAQAWRWWEKAAAEGNETARAELKKWKDALENMFCTHPTASFKVRLAACEYLWMLEDKVDPAAVEAEILKKYPFPQSGTDWTVLHQFVFKDLRRISEQSTKPKASPCFIATAAYGSADAPDVKILRAFRDQSLASHRIGRQFIRAYERLSPHLAAVIANRPALRSMVRKFLICPLARLVH